MTPVTAPPRPRIVPVGRHIDVQQKNGKIEHRRVTDYDITWGDVLLGSYPSKEDAERIVEGWDLAMKHGRRAVEGLLGVIG